MDIFKIIFGGYLFNISANSFYQVNPIQTEKLYGLAIKNAKINKSDIVFDLYCGIGTIGIFASKYAKKVYGIEIIEDAIANAKDNAKINKINNIEFIAGDVECTLSRLMEKENCHADIVFVDPPRKGLDEITISNLLKINSKKIIYISCNPATLMRDLSKMQDKYYIDSITPVDLFPFTSHVECVAVVRLRKDEK